MIEDKFSLTFDYDMLPLKVNKIDKIEDGYAIMGSKPHTDRLVKYINKELENINIEFNVKESDTVESFMRSWYDLYSNHKENPMNDFFTLFEPEPGTATSINFKLRKPIDKLTDDDIVRLKKVLKENFSIDNPDDVIKKWLN